jgi:hypothetical protein
MKTCIICRKEKANFNDEHVIPDSIGGYYHIDKVCVDCNSLLGYKIDNKLTNHKFIEFQRHLLGISGKKGSIPNPLKGIHMFDSNPEQKVQLFLDKDGKFDIELISNTSNSISSEGKFTIEVDKKNEAEIETITEKFLSRNGIPKDQVKQEIRHESLPQPKININLKIDIHNFKLSLLKIAYEYTVDQVPEYFNDDKAKEISQILHTADFEGLKNVIMYGDGLNKKVLEPFSHLIDFENNNHYLILFDSETTGLMCCINLFNCFFLGFHMTEKYGFIKDNLLVGKNDIVNKNFKVYTIQEIVSHTYSPITYRFKYLLPPDKYTIDEFLTNDRNVFFTFYKENGVVPFFDNSGIVKYVNIDLKLSQSQLQKNEKGDTINEMITEIILDEELYIKLLPINKLYRVVAVNIEQYKRAKL